MRRCLLKFAAGTSLLAAALVLLAGSPAATRFAPAETLRLRVAVPAEQNGTTGDLNIVFENTSEVPQGIFEQWNSWGAGSLKLDFTLPGGTHQIAHNGQGVWDRNFPSLTVLRPGQTVVWVLGFDRGRWVDLPKNVWLNKPVRVKAIFEQQHVKPLVGPATSIPWVGHIESPEVDVQLFWHTEAVENGGKEEQFEHLRVFPSEENRVLY